MISPIPCDQTRRCRPHHRDVSTCAADTWEIRHRTSWDDDTSKSIGRCGRNLSRCSEEGCNYRFSRARRTQVRRVTSTKLLSCNKQYPHQKTSLPLFCRASQTGLSPDNRHSQPMSVVWGQTCLYVDTSNYNEKHMTYDLQKTYVQRK